MYFPANKMNGLEQKQSEYDQTKQRIQDQGDKWSEWVCAEKRAVLTTSVELYHLDNNPHTKMP